MAPTVFAGGDPLMSPATLSQPCPRPVAAISAWTASLSLGLLRSMSATRYRRRQREPRNLAQVFWLCALVLAIAGILRNWLVDYPISASLGVVPLLYYWQGYLSRRWLPLPPKAIVLIWGMWCTILAVVALAGWR